MIFSKWYQSHIKWIAIISLSKWLIWVTSKWLIWVTSKWCQTNQLKFWCNLDVKTTHLSYIKISTIILIYFLYQTDFFQVISNINYNFDIDLMLKWHTQSFFMHVLHMHIIFVARTLHPKLPLFACINNINDNFEFSRNNWVAMDLFGKWCLWESSLHIL
jgi:hypothetical protein